MGQRYTEWTVGIMDCTTHMAEGGMKDAAYILGIFDEKVMEYDPKMLS